MRRRLPSLVAAAFLAFAGAPSLAGSSLPPPDDAVLLRPGSGEYRIGPGDTLDVAVDQVPELSKPFQVDNAGKLLLPLVGQVNAAGRTPNQLSQDLVGLLKQKYMRDPQVVVSLKEAQGQRVTVDGAVVQPGMYPLAGPTTLLQAVALAKGPDPKLANPRRVAVVRTIGGAKRTAFFDLVQIRQGRAQDPEIYGNDIVVVDTSGTKSFMQNFQGGFGLLGMLIRPW